MAKVGSFCHVFLSFRGEVRNNFACFLYNALKADGFQPFMDRENMDAGDEVDLGIQEGIKNSMSAIVVFSQNYAFSRYCLDELILILKRKKSSRYFIIPILHDVKSGDVKHQNNNFGKALERHKVRYGDKQVGKWRAALKEAGKILAEHFDGNRDDFITRMVKLFRKKFSAEFPEYPLPSPLPLIPYTELDQGASDNQLQSPQNQNVPTIHNNTKSNASPSTSQPNEDPLSGYLMKCPPGGEAKVVLYTSSIGVRSTTQNCNAMKDILEDHNLEFEERDAWMYPMYKDELMKLVDTLSYPRLFVSGRDIGGLRKVEELRDNGELDAMLKYHKQQQGNSRYMASPNKRIKRQ